MDRYEGKVAVVTGASAGIGAAIVKSLTRAGLKVVAIARRVERVEAFQDHLKDAKGQLYPIKGDVSKIEEVARIFEWVKTKFGTVHVLINNAGIGRNGGIVDGKLQDLVDVINTNLTGVLACTQYALRLMEASGVDDGHIIHINSIAGHYVPNLPVNLNIYPSTKHGVTAFTESLRQELVRKKSKIRVSSISPGAVETEIGQAMAEASGLALEDMMAARLTQDFPRLQSEDIADAVIYVLAAPPHVQVHELIIKPVGESC